MPLDDSDPYWAARFRMTPDQMDALRRKAEATARDGYHAATRAMAQAGQAAHRFGDEAGAAVDRFKTGVQAEVDKALGRPAATRPPIAPRPVAPAPAPATPRPPTPREAARASGAGILMDRIAMGEGTGGPDGYDTTYGYRRYDPPGGRKPLAEMTLDELDAYQRGMAARGSTSTAAGRYQILRKTAGELRGQMGLRGDERFTPELQDRMARQLLTQRGWDDYVAGRITRDELQERLAKEWASVATTGGASHHNQPVGTSTDDIRAAIDRARAEADRLSASGGRTSIPARR